MKTCIQVGIPSAVHHRLVLSLFCRPTGKSVHSLYLQFPPFFSCTMLPRVGKLVLSRTALLLCDLQEKFRNQISHFQAITQVSGRMLQAARILGMRIVVTEMYPKGLGKTVPELGDLSGIPVIPKTSFSMYTEDVANLLELGKEIDSVLLCGIEAHVCVQATALDLVERGADVHCITDACSSRNMVDRMVAFHRMSQAGVYLTTCESALLTILCGSHHPCFREIQKLILEPSPDSGLLSGVAPANPFVGLNS
ncbi:Isochorismatase domain-containing protein 2 mitochondrial [Paragonimus heterotremus]|uniref:Isochorismatase domain-containing protein 2 mitochondrial n=1 Tax=Paragonimus heterotremus TaxID=100268 RepID=A0A8J4WH28_9TREM|nr:Isochorismatase domain-containing protein 2 mitochondrial [Paragonimus heterotremus]